MPQFLTYSQIEPPPQLSGHVRCLWQLRGSTQPVTREAIVPDGMPELVLNFGDPFRHHRDGRPAERQHRAILVGQATRPFELEPGSRIDLLGVRFWPGGATGITKVPMSQLTDGYADLAAVAGALAAPLECLFGEPDRGLRMALLVRALADGYSGAAASPLAMMARRAVLDPSGTTVDLIARELRLGTRQLSRRFGREVGVGPKTLLRICRLQRLLRKLEHGRPTSLARAAAEFGFYDQSHLVREFRALVGASPSGYLAACPGLAQQLVDSELDGSLA